MYKTKFLKRFTRQSIDLKVHVFDKHIDCNNVVFKYVIFPCSVLYRNLTFEPLCTERPSDQDEMKKNPLFVNATVIIRSIAKDCHLRFARFACKGEGNRNPSTGAEAYDLLIRTSFVAENIVSGKQAAIQIMMEILILIYNSNTIRK